MQCGRFFINDTSYKKSLSFWEQQASEVCRQDGLSAEPGLLEQEGLFLARPIQQAVRQEYKYLRSVRSLSSAPYVL